MTASAPARVSSSSTPRSIYRGPRLIGEITQGLARLLAADGFASLAQAVGADHRAGP